ncbi:43887_t:CDS:1, partial [Gigaspora margarita]
VNNSLSKLNEIFNQINTLVNNFDVVNVIISNQYKVNNIVIYLDQPELYQAFINSTKKLNPTPIIEGPNEAIKENSSSTLKSRENNSPILESRENNSPTLESRENNSPTLESREIQLRILSGYSIAQIHEGYLYRCTAGFWVRQQGLTYLTTVGHCALNATLDPHGSIRFFFIIPGTDQLKFFGNMTRFEVEPVDRGFILQFDEHFESPYIYSKELQVPLFAIADFTRTPVHFIDGTLLCKSGSTTGYSCGRVKSIIVNTVMSHDGYGKFNYTGMVEVNTRGEYGDSGSPVFSFSNPLGSRTGVNLFGMVIGVTRDESTILFTPLYQILDSDMDVVTNQE